MNTGQRGDAPDEIAVVPSAEHYRSSTRLPAVEIDWAAASSWLIRASMATCVAIGWQHRDHSGTLTCCMTLLLDSHRGGASSQYRRSIRSYAKHLSCVVIVGSVLTQPSHRCIHQKGAVRVFCGSRFLVRRQYEKHR